MLGVQTLVDLTEIRGANVEVLALELAQVPYDVSPGSHGLSLQRFHLGESVRSQFVRNDAQEVVLERQLVHHCHRRP